MRVFAVLGILIACFASIALAQTVRPQDFGKHVQAEIDRNYQASMPRYVGEVVTDLDKSRQVTIRFGTGELNIGKGDQVIVTVVNKANKENKKPSKPTKTNRKRR